MQITKGRIPSAVKTVIYGPEGIGKSTLASKWPDPVFIDTEGSTKMMDVARFPAPETWDNVIDSIKYACQNPDCCRTLVIDTADWAEMLCMKDLLKKNTMESIEDFGYGKGYVKLAEKFKSMLDELDKVISAGIHVVITAHAAMRKFEQPDEMGAYDRWEMKLQKKTAPLVKEWADMVLFCNYKTHVVETKDKKKKATGGERVIYTTHHSCWDAKNRFGLDDQLSMEYGSIAAAIGDVPKAEPKWKSLEKLMEKDGIELFDLQNLVGMKGWAMSTDPIANYSNELVDFIMENWEGIKEAISKIKDQTEIPFE